MSSRTYLPTQRSSGLHLSPSHPMRSLKSGASKKLPLTFMGAGVKPIRKPKLVFPNRAPAKTISPEEAARHRRMLKALSE